MEATKLQDNINEALDKVCPVKDKTTKSQPPRWWNTELHNLKKKVKQAHKDWKTKSTNHEANQTNVLDSKDAFFRVMAAFLSETMFLHLKVP